MSSTEAKAPKTLKLFNGNGLCCRKLADPRWKGLPSNAAPHAYVAAYSRADARRVIAEYCGRTPGDSLLRDFFHDTWGDSMRDIVPERGLWLRFGQGAAPVRVL